MPALLPIFLILLLVLFSIALLSNRGEPPQLYKPPSKTLLTHRNRRRLAQSFRAVLSSPSALAISLTGYLLRIRAGGIRGNRFKKVRNKEKSNSVVEFFSVSLDKEIGYTLAAYLVLVLLKALSPASFISIQWPVITIPLAPISVFIAVRFITNYRIENGYYGNNRYEASHLIEFVEKNSDDSDFPGGPGKKVFKSQKHRKARSFRRLGEGAETA